MTRASGNCVKGILTLGFFPQSWSKLQIADKLHTVISDIQDSAGPSVVQAGSKIVDSLSVASCWDYRGSLSVDEDHSCGQGYTICI